MGGLALGVAVAARFVRRLTRPVLAYGVLELGIAIGAMCVPFLIRGLQAAYFSIAGSLDAPPETMALTTALFHLAGSFVVVETREGWRLRTNGLPEAGLYRVGMPDLRNKETSWLSLLPAAARPEAKQILIIGLGSGQTLDAVPSTVSSIDVIELEEDVVIANRLIPPSSQPPRRSTRLSSDRRCTWRDEPFQQALRRNYLAALSPLDSGRVPPLYTRIFRTDPLKARNRRHEQLPLHRPILVSRGSIAPRISSRAGR